MKKYNVSELFFSLEGEGPETNHPTQYLRIAGCNFSCPGFNNPEKKIDKDGYAELGFNPEDIIDIKQMPVITCGCDSQYAVNYRFKHLWASLTSKEIAEKVLDQIPCKSWVYPNTELPVIFSITGGEPTMQQDLIIELLSEPLMQECQHILIETNCSVPLKSEFISAIEDWLLKDKKRIWTWSNSPKLLASGESWKRAIRPKVALSQNELKKVFGTQVNQYFKFVVDDTQEVYSEIQKALQEYYDAGIPKNTPVWLMPCACTAEQQRMISQNVAKYCMQNGYLYSHRIQNDLWDNAVGT